LVVDSLTTHAPFQFGRTALHLAVTAGSSNGALGIVNALLAAGALHTAVDQDGATPLFLAADAGDKDVVQALLAAGANTETKTKLHEEVHWRHNGHGVAAH
jgi:ankyrin repeat protein